MTNAGNHPLFFELQANLQIANLAKTFVFAVKHKNDGVSLFFRQSRGTSPPALSLHKVASALHAHSPWVRIRHSRSDNDRLITVAFQPTLFHTISVMRWTLQRFAAQIGGQMRSIVFGSTFPMIFLVQYRFHGIGVFLLVSRFPCEKRASFQWPSQWSDTALSFSCILLPPHQFRRL